MIKYSFIGVIFGLLIGMAKAQIDLRDLPEVAVRVGFSPSGKALTITFDEEGRVICAPNR